MKIEKVKSKLKKVFNRVMGVLLPVATLFVSCGTNALVVHAAEASVKNILSFYTTEINQTEKYTRHIKSTIEIFDGVEIVGLCRRGNDNELRSLQLLVIKNNDLDTKYLEKFDALQIVDNSTGHHEVTLKGTNRWFNNLPYSGSGLFAGAQVSYGFELIEGKLKLFNSLDDIKAYASTGAGDYDIIKPDTIDDGVKDPDIGYLHNLQRNSLQSGKQDENGIYEKYSARFTWDDTYPEYDSSYLVEVRGKCVVQTRGFLGFWKTKTYTSDIENIAKDISYNDLEWVISNTDQYAPFNSFINEHMPTNLVMTGVYGMRDYYFRIYKWSDTDECYHYGSWVNMHYIDDDLWISNVQESTVGDFDDNGNFIVNPDSDYGTGTKKSDGVGVGDTEEDAKKDNDRREEEKKNDDGKLDLSNASISDIWYWFVTSLSNLYNSLGFIPEFFQKIFSFLPTPIYVFLGIGIVVAILLRVLGR